MMLKCKNKNINSDAKVEIKRHVVHCHTKHHDDHDEIIDNMKKRRYMEAPVRVDPKSTLVSLESLLD